MEVWTLASWLFWAVLVYKILDWLIRKPRLIGRTRRYILVTGCDTGFGHEITQRLEKNGYNVFAGCLTEKGVTMLRKLCSDRVKPFRMDVADHDSVLKAYEYVKATLPEGRGLWGVLNNAGAVGAMGPVPWLELADYRAVMDVNLLGLIDVTRTFLPLVKAERGRVVSTSSMFGRTSMSGGGPYNVSKYGVEAFMDGLRRELHDFGCTAHLIEPGFHKTNMGSAVALGPAMERPWKRLSPEQKAEYGEEYYEKARHLLLNKFLSLVASERISDVLDAYEHALVAVFPRARYVVGWDARLFFLPVQALPEWLGDRILRLVSRDRPLPAAVNTGKK